MIVLKRSAFVHIPKTGGTWVRKVLKQASPHFSEVGYEHATYPDIVKVAPGAARSHVFCFLRHPFEWYRSYWAYKVQNKWGGVTSNPNSVDFKCYSYDFEEYLQNVIERAPGFLSTYYRVFSTGCGFLGRYEALRRDLVMAMVWAGEPFDEVVLEGMSPANVTKGKFKEKARCSLGVQEALIQSEQEAMDMWAQTPMMRGGT